MKTSGMDDYIAGFPPDVQKILKKIRVTIRKAAPDAEETIKYQIPTFTLKGNMLSFAAYKTHVGLYPAPKGTQEFNKELSAYRAAKHSVRFPLDEPIPVDLIRDIVKFRIANMKAKAKKK